MTMTKSGTLALAIWFAASGCGFAQILTRGGAGPPNADLDLNYGSTMTLGSVETFTRADASTVATQYNSNGDLITVTANTPRFDYDPVSKAPLGFLIETTRQNRALYSNDFSQASFWTLTNVTLGTATTGIDAGASSGKNVLSSVTPGVNNLVQSASMTISAGNTLIIPIVAKKQGYPVIRCQICNAAATNCVNDWYHFDKDIFGFPTASGSGWTVTQHMRRFSNRSFVHLWFTITTAVDTTATVACGGVPNLGDTTITGDGTSGVYLFHVGLEVGNHPTPSIIQTSGAAKTRAADRASFDPTVKIPGFASDHGSVLVEFAVLDFGESSPTVFGMRGPANASSGGTVLLQTDSGGKPLFSVRDATNTAGTAIGELADTTRLATNKVGLIWSTNYSAATVNGAIDERTGAKVPPANGLGIATIGHGTAIGTDTSMLDGWMSRLRIWVPQLSLSQIGSLAAMTGATPGTYRVGVNLAGLEFNGDVAPGTQGVDFFNTTAAEYVYYSGKNVKFMRLPIRWERAQPTLGGALDATYMGYVDQAMTDAAANGSTILLDIHNYGRRYVSGVSKQINDSDGIITFAHFTDLWSRLSARYAGNAGLGGYDLVNEPKMGPGAGDNFSTFYAYQLAIDAIRANDMVTPIYIEGNIGATGRHFASSNRNLYLYDPADNLVYSGHVYFDAPASGIYSSSYAVDGATPYIGSNRVTTFIHWCIANNKKCHVGEFGNPIAAEWLTVEGNFLVLLKAKRVEHTIWSGGRAWGSYALSVEPKFIGTPQEQDREQFTTLLNYLP